MLTRSQSLQSREQSHDAHIADRTLPSTREQDMAVERQDERCRSAIGVSVGYVRRWVDTAVKVSSGRWAHGVARQQETYLIFAALYIGPPTV